MLIEFCVENFRSYKDMQCLNLQATSLKEFTKSNLLQAGKYKLLKSKVLYGANASGKSNLIKALFVFLDIVLESVRDEHVLSRIEPFALSEQTTGKPSFFQIMFVLDGVFYRYGFEVDQIQVHSEWLFGAPAGREVPFFIRERQEITSFSQKYFKEGKRLYDLFKKSNEIFRKNSLFLTAVAAMNGQVATKIKDFFRSIILIGGIDDPNLLNYAIYRVNKQDEKQEFVKFLKYADIQIKDLKLVARPNGKRLIAVVERYDETGHPTEPIELDFFQTQSKGTIKLLELAPAILDALKEGRILIIDEFDARLHPIIAKDILQLFNSPENTKAQLIAASHCTNLMDRRILRRDQIDFVDKDNHGASHIYSLAEFKGVRKHVPFEKYYLSGQFSGVPKSRLKQIVYEQEK